MKCVWNGKRENLIERKKTEKKEEERERTGKS